jgi:hypothetical protein
MSEWISSLKAVLRLRDAGLNAPEATLGLWAEEGFVKSRASWGRFSHDGGVDELTFPNEPSAVPDGLGVSKPWPDIPSDFWHYVNVKNGNAEAHYEAGIFAALVELDPEIGTHSETEHMKLYGVSFHSDDLDALLNGVGERQPKVPLSKTARSNAGDKPKTDGWADFGAALALFISEADNSQLRSTNGVYEAVANKLLEAGRTPLVQKTVKPMIDRARLWIEAGEVAEASAE